MESNFVPPYLSLVVILNGLDTYESKRETYY